MSVTEDGKGRAEARRRFPADFVARYGCERVTLERTATARGGAPHSLLVVGGLALEDAVERAPVDAEQLGGAHLVAAGLVEHLV